MTRAEIGFDLRNKSSGETTRALHLGLEFVNRLLELSTISDRLTGVSTDHRRSWGTFAVNSGVRLFFVPDTETGIALPEATIYLIDRDRPVNTIDVVDPLEVVSYAMPSSAEEPVIRLKTFDIPGMGADKFGLIDFSPQETHELAIIPRD